MTDATAAELDAGAGIEPALAPAPQVDRYPIVIGQGLSLGYVSSAFRSCLAGYRQQYVDLLDELMEKDPHAYSVVSKRVLTVGSGRIEISPPEKLKGAELTQATEVAEFVQSEIDGIPSIVEALTLLAWATYYAVGAQEIMWTQRDDGTIGVDSLSFVHHRRLSYPDPWSWDLYIFDQGASLGVRGAQRAGMYGMRIADHPGKFIVHAPKVRGDYPTREGIGRQIAYWMTIKNIATRLAPQYLERYAIPWPDFEFNTQTKDNVGEPRVASTDDINGAEIAAKALGNGALSHYVHADAVKVKLNAPEGTPTLTFSEWIQLCDSQMSKAALGATLTTEVGSSGGNRALGGVQKQGEEKLYEFDGISLAATVKRDLVDWLVKLNFPALARKLFPKVKLHVNADPDAADILDRATKAALGGIAVDGDAIAQQVNIPTLPNTTGTARRMVPMSPVSMSVSPEVVGLPKPDPALAPAPALGALVPNAPPIKPSKEPTDARTSSDS